MFDSATSHGTIAVSDMDAAKKFYEGTLGLKSHDDAANIENDCFRRVRSRRLPLRRKSRTPRAMHSGWPITKSISNLPKR